MSIKLSTLAPEVRAMLHSGLGALGPRKVLYLAETDTDAYAFLRDDSGVDQANLFSTFTQVNQNIAENDMVLVYPTTYSSELAAVTVTKKNTKWFAAGYGRNRALSETYWQNYGLGYDAMIIDASSVEVAGLSFVQSAGKSGIIVANGAGTGGVYIHDCYFYDVAQTGDYHVINGTSSYNAVGTMIEDCHFFKGKNLLTVFGNRTNIRNCYFDIMGGCVGIQHTAGRQGTWIVDNYFQAQGTVGTQQGIFFAATPDNGSVHISGNRFANFAAEVNCINKEDAVLIPFASENYWGNTLITLA